MFVSISQVDRVSIFSQSRSEDASARPVRRRTDALANLENRVDQDRRAGGRGGQGQQSPNPEILRSGCQTIESRVPGQRLAPGEGWHEFVNPEHNQNASPPLNHNGHFRDSTILEPAESARVQICERFLKYSSRFTKACPTALSNRRPKYLFNIFGPRGKARRLRRGAPEESVRVPRARGARGGPPPGAPPRPAHERALEPARP